MKKITLPLILIVILVIYILGGFATVFVRNNVYRVDSLIQENVLFRSNNIALLQNKIKDNNKPKEVEVQAACPSEDVQILIGPALIQIPEGFFDGEENKITPEEIEEDNNDLAPTLEDAYKEYREREKRRMGI